MITDKVKGGRQKRGGGDRGRIMSVEKKHAFINIKAISIKMLVLTESRKGGRRQRGENNTDFVRH